MTTRRLLVGLVLSQSLALAAAAQVTWTDVGCESAEISFGSGYRCRVSNEVNPGNPLLRQHYASVSGEVAGLRLSATLFVLNAGGLFSPYGAEESARMIKGFVAQSTPEASWWGTYRGFGDTGYIPFTRGGLQCAGFDHGLKRASEPSGTNGYRQLLRGYFCERTAGPIGEVRLRQVLGALRLAEGRNAFGEPVAPLSSSASAR